MKLTAMCLLAVCLHAAARTEGQTITLSVKNKPLEKVLNEIKRQSKFSFVYGKELVKEAAPVTIDVRDNTLVKVLDQIFQHQKLDYKVFDDYIILSPKRVGPTQGSAGTIPNLPPPIDISGKVTDESGTPLIGATVMIKGTRNITSTNAEGAYVLKNIDEQATLVVSFIGMETQEIKVKGKEPISIVMKLAIMQGQDVVVVGYGTQKRELLTASVGSVKFDEVKRSIPAKQLGNLLAGQIAGVNVATPRGIPGSNPGISIRQKSSWNTQDVLYVIDGRIAEGGEFNLLSPNEIDNITVLKDAASTAVYGSRAAAGVIVVTTRRGKSGKASIEYSYQTGFDRRGRNSDLMNAVQYFEYQNRITPNTYSQTVIDKFKTINNGWGYDQLSTVWNDPSTSTHNLSITGGSDKVQYFIGGSINKEQLFLKNMSSQNYNVRANIKARITNGLTAEALLSLNNNIRKFPSVDGWDDIYGKLRIWQAYQPVWTTDGHPVDYGWIQNVGAQVRGDNGYRNESALRPVVNLKLNYEIPGVKGLSVTGQYSKSFFNQRR